MSAPEPMPSVRRRPIPGMTRPASASPPSPPLELKPNATDTVATDHDGSAHPPAVGDRRNASPMTGPRAPTIASAGRDGRPPEHGGR